MPGGPISVRIAPERLSSSMPRSTRSFLHRDVLGDAVLDVLEAGVVGVEHLARVHRVELLVGALRPRHGDQPVEVGADHRRLAGLLAHALEAAELLLGLLATASGMPASAIFVRYSSTTEPASSPSSRRIDSICLRRKYSRCCFSAPDSTSSRMRLADLQLGQPLALEAQRQLEALGDVERLQQLDLLLEGEVGRVARRVGERAGLGDRAQERGRRGSSAPRSSRISSTTARYSRSSSRVRPSTGSSSGCSVDLDAQAAGGVGVRGAGDAAGDAGQRDGAAAAGQADAVGDLGDRADLGVLALVARDEQDALLVADVDRERDVHGREDDGVVQGDQQERRRHIKLLSTSHLRIVPQGSTDLSVGH